MVQPSKKVGMQSTKSSKELKFAHRIELLRWLGGKLWHHCDLSARPEKVHQWGTAKRTAKLWRMDSVEETIQNSELLNAQTSQNFSILLHTSPQLLLFLFVSARLGAGSFSTTWCCEQYQQVSTSNSTSLLHYHQDTCQGMRELHKCHKWSESGSTDFAKPKSQWLNKYCVKMWFYKTRGKITWLLSLPLPKWRSIRFPTSTGLVGQSLRFWESTRTAQ